VAAGEIDGLIGMLGGSKQDERRTTNQNRKLPSIITALNSDP
jgi:hypothetical protein